jgi:hypothetical protein
MNIREGTHPFVKHNPSKSIKDRKDLDGAELEVTELLVMR